jgi:type IV pilus assembly protein PilB
MALSTAQLIEVAIEQELVDQETVSRLRVQARRDRTDLLEAIMTEGRFPIGALYRAWAERQGIPFVDLSKVTAYPPLVKRLPSGLLRRRQMLPVSDEGEQMVLATADPQDHASVEAIERLIGRPVTVAMADPEALAAAIELAVADVPGDAAEGPAPVHATDPISLLDRIFKEAFLRRASDIHLEPQPNGLRVRLRVDGRLQIYIPALNVEDGIGLVSRVKVLAGLDIAEQREAQDGGFSYRLHPRATRNTDMRVATAPTRWGERATLRLLGLETQDLTLVELGWDAQEIEQFRAVIQRPHGMILLVGPTGSGKTTTLYAALREINRPDRNILTVEDPIEYAISGISQTQVGEKISFAQALRSFLRHDPDVLLIGEIRDEETADVAIKASMTGHLVFSTLHTHSAVSAVTRLLDIGCERYLIASTLIASIAQRLVRRLCPRCRHPRPATAEEAEWLGGNVEPGLILYDPGGCAHCLGSGYRGRIGLFEAFWVSLDLMQLIYRGASEEELKAAAKGRLTSLWAAGRAKILAGLTSIEEVSAVTVREV